MAEKYTYGFYRALGESFKQSIITTYDFIDEDVPSLKNVMDIGSVYRIEASYQSGDADNRADLETIIERLV